MTKKESGAQSDKAAADGAKLLGAGPRGDGDAENDAAKKSGDDDGELRARVRAGSSPNEMQSDSDRGARRRAGER